MILSTKSELPDFITRDCCDLSVVIPTYNESENIPILLDRLEKILQELNYEIIVVDDNSPDLTWKIAQDIGQQDSRVRCLRRMENKGLSNAVVDGMSISRGNVIAVMDADLQHDESILPRLFDSVSADGNDIAVGSREAEGGSYGEWSSKRKFISYGAKMLAKLALSVAPKDPMSGFFALSRQYFDSTIDRVNPSGFKILLEFAMRGDNPKVSEIGYHFRNRLHGETKLNATIAIEYLLALIDLKFGWLIPSRFVKFGMVGFAGSLVNLLGFAITQMMGASLPISIFIGIELSIIFTFLSNNFFTFTPQTYRGLTLLYGFLIYQIVSLYGLVVQYSVVDTLVSNFPFIGDSLFTLYSAYLVGVAFAAIGNYFLHAYYTWNRLGHNLRKPIKRSYQRKS